MAPFLVTKVWTLQESPITPDPTLGKHRPYYACEAARHFEESAMAPLQKSDLNILNFPAMKRVEDVRARCYRKYGRVLKAQANKDEWQIPSHIWSCKIGFRLDLRMSMSLGYGACISPYGISWKTCARARRGFGGLGWSRCS